MKYSQIVQYIRKDLDETLTENQIRSVLHLAQCYGMKPPKYSKGWSYIPELGGRVEHEVHEWEEEI